MLSLYNQRSWGQSPENPINLIQRSVEGKPSSYSCAFSRHMGPLLLEDPQLAYKILKKLTRNVPIGADAKDGVRYEKEGVNFKFFKQHIGRKLVNKIGRKMPKYSDDQLQLVLRFTGALDNLIDMKNDAHKVQPRNGKLIVHEKYNVTFDRVPHSFTVKGDGEKYIIDVSKHNINLFVNKIYNDFFKNEQFNTGGFEEWFRYAESGVFDDSKFIIGFQRIGNCNVTETGSTVTKSVLKNLLYAIIDYKNIRILFFLLIPLIKKTSLISGITSAYIPYSLLSPFVINFFISMWHILSFYSKPLKGTSKTKKIQVWFGLTFLKVLVSGWIVMGNGASFFNYDPQVFALSSVGWFFFELFRNYYQLALDTTEDVKFNKKTGAWLVLISSLQVLELNQFILSKEVGVATALAIEHDHSYNDITIVENPDENLKNAYKGLVNLNIVCDILNNDPTCKKVQTILKKIPNFGEDLNNPRPIITLKSTLSILSIEEDIKKIEVPEKLYKDTYKVFKNLFQNNPLVNRLRQSIGRSVFSNYNTFSSSIFTFK